jgi:hypothetical protein
VGIPCLSLPCRFSSMCIFRVHVAPPLFLVSGMSVVGGFRLLPPCQCEHVSQSALSQLCTSVRICCTHACRN